MTTDELKSIFQSYCCKDGDSPGKKLFGLEYENFVMIPKADDTAKTFEPLQVEGDKGVFRILENLADLTKEDNDPLEKVYEKEMLLALKRPSGAKVTIEPGGQIELSDAPRNSLSESNESLQNYLKLLKKAVAEFDGKLLFQGVQPLHELEKLPFFKKGRYQIMFSHMLKTGSLGQWMMKASSGVQVSIDYESIEDMQRKFVFLNRLSPFLSALFANSPLVEGKPCGYLSYRSHIWNNTDDTRTGLQTNFLREKGGFHRSVEFSQLYGMVPFGKTGFDESAIFYWRRGDHQLNKILTNNGYAGVKELYDLLEDFDIDRSSPIALKVATGKICAISGNTWSEGLSEKKQN